MLVQIESHIGVGIFQMALQGIGKRKFNASKSFGQVLESHRHRLCIPGTRHDTCQVVPTIFLLYAGEIIQRRDKGFACRIFKFGLCQFGRYGRDTHGITHTQGVGIFFPLIDISGIESIFACHRLHIDRRIERGFSFFQLFEDETIDSFYTVVFAGYAGESRQSRDRSEAVGYFSIQISTPDTGHLNHIFIIRVLFGFACLDLLFSQFDSLGGFVEPAYGIGVAEVEGDIIVIVRTDRESAAPVKASGTIPFGNEDTFGNLGIHLCSDNRGVQEPFRLHFVLTYLVRIFVYFLKIITGREQSGY